MRNIRSTVYLSGVVLAVEVLSSGSIAAADRSRAFDKYTYVAFNMWHDVVHHEWKKPIVYLHALEEHRRDLSLGTDQLLEKMAQFRDELDSAEANAGGKFRRPPLTTEVLPILFERVPRAKIKPYLRRVSERIIPNLGTSYIASFVGDQPLELKGGPMYFDYLKSARDLHREIYEEVVDHSRGEPRFREAIDFASFFSGGIDGGVGLNQRTASILEDHPDFAAQHPLLVLFVRPDGQVRQDLESVLRVVPEAVAVHSRLIAQMLTELVEINDNIDRAPEIIADPQRDAQLDELVEEESRRDRERIQAADNTVYFVVSALNLFPEPNGIIGVAKIKKLAEEMGALGKAGTKISEAYKGFKEVAQKPWTWEWISKRLTHTSAIVGGVIDIVNLLRNRSAGPGPEQIILQEIQALKAQVSQLRDEMHVRFDRVDLALREIFDTLVDNFNHIEGRLDEVEAILNFLLVRIDRLETTIQSYFWALFKQKFDETLELCKKIDNEFLKCLTLFLVWAEKSSRDSISAPTVERPFGDAEIGSEILKFPLEMNTPWLLRLAKAKDWGDPVKTDVPNPIAWNASVDAYLTILGDQPELASMLNPSTLREELDRMIVAGQEIQGAFRALRTAAFFENLFSYYRRKAEPLERRIIELRRIHGEDKLQSLLTRAREDNIGTWLTTILPPEGASMMISDPIVNVYRGFSHSGGGAPYSGFVGRFTTPRVSFPRPWVPLGQGVFGAHITGSLRVESSGTYTFRITSDDGALFLIDGNIVLNNGGDQPCTGAEGRAMLTAGIHFFEVQYFNGQGRTCLDLVLPPGVSYAVVAPPLLAPKDIDDLIPIVFRVAQKEGAGEIRLTSIAQWVDIRTEFNPQFTGPGIPGPYIEVPAFEAIVGDNCAVGVPSGLWEAARVGKLYLALNASFIPFETGTPAIEIFSRVIKGREKRFARYVHFCGDNIPQCVFQELYDDCFNSLEFFEVPAASELSLTWNTDDGVYLSTSGPMIHSALRPVFVKSSVEQLPKAKQDESLSAITATILKLHKAELLGILDNDFVVDSALRLAAQEFDGAKLALQAYLRLVLSRCSSTNEYVGALLFGSEPILDSAGVRQLLLSGQEAEEVAAVIDARINVLSTLILGLLADPARVTEEYDLVEVTRLRLLATKFDLDSQWARFRRGDSNASGTVDVADAIAILNYFFLGGPRPDCQDAADVDDSGTLEITDPIGTLDYLFQGKTPPAAPGPTSCGADPTPDTLVCELTESCQ